MGTIYAQLELNEGEALAFDYKMSTNAENDYFYVTVDARKESGMVTSGSSGTNTSPPLLSLLISWCQREYPYLKAAYEKYSDDLEILGINDISESNPRPEYR